LAITHALEQRFEHFSLTVYITNNVVRHTKPFGT
jgi:hypothetical protein